MFEAIILVLTLRGGTIMLTDNRGPYEVQADCAERLVEMEAFVRKTMPVVKVKAECKFNGDQVL